MNSKAKGIITPIATIIIMTVVAIIAVLITESVSNDGWSGFIAVLFVLMITGLILIIELIIGIVLYNKDKSDYALGLMYSIAGITLVGFAFQIFTRTYNMFV